MLYKIRYQKIASLTSSHDLRVTEILLPRELILTGVSNLITYSVYSDSSDMIESGSGAVCIANLWPAPGSASLYKEDLSVFRANTTP